MQQSMYNQLKEAMSYRHMNPVRLASSSGVAVSTIYRILNRETGISPETFVKLMHTMCYDIQVTSTPQD